MEHGGEMSNLSDSGARGEAGDRDVLVGPGEVVALLVRGVTRPVRVVEVGPGEHAEVGATSGDDRVHVGPRGDVADRHRRDSALVAAAGAERGAEQPAPGPA